MTKFENIISKAIRDSVSDLYITGGHPMVSRIHGSIQFHNSIKWSHQEVDDLVQSILSPRYLDVLRMRKSVDYALSVSDARLRVNIFATMGGLSLAIRILPGHIPTIDELNLHPSLHEIANIKSGLVLTCGPTGVGKTTTVASIVNHINSSCRVHVITLENPIEYRFQSKMAFIQQRELGTHMPSFAQGLVDVLRENPDIIVVGELRDAETMHLTLNAAESGHLVIATMHASTPEEAIYRLCNAVPLEAQNEIRYQLASTLNWLIVQQLVYMEKVGYRVPALTIVRAASSIKNIIRENKLNQINSAVQMGKNEGMFTTERYVSEYLNNRTTFTPYMQTFRPSTETSQDETYASPLTEIPLDAAPLKKKMPVHPSEPIVIRNQYSHGEIDNMLTIDKGESLQELLNKLKS
jgi:twitching motility protein PilT